VVPGPTGGLQGAAAVPVRRLAVALGRVSANAYPLDKLPADATTNKFAPEMELWRDLFVTGADRWLIRGDGRISSNGEFVADLAEDVEWQGIVVVNGDYVALRVYDAQGRCVRVLAQGRVELGRRTLMWDGRDMRGARASSGIYFVRLSAGSFTGTRKLLVLER